MVAPRNAEDVERTIAICREAGAPVLPRGAGTSQCGQTVGEAVVVDTSRHLHQVLGVDEEARRVTVQPGVVLDRLNAWLKPTGLFFPVDVSPANRATIGGMTGNNSCGARSIRYGNMVHNVHAVSAVLADGNAVRFGEVSGNLAGFAGDDHYTDLIRRMRALGDREADEIARRFPALLRRVGGYNIDTLAAPGGGHNMAHLLVGSEGTLGFFTEIELDLQPLPAHRVLGVCHFPAFHEAMSATQHIVALDPSAVELVDRTPHRACARHRGVPPHRRAVRAGGARRTAARRVRGGGPRHPPVPARPARRADGRPRVSRRGGRGGGALVPERGLGGAQGGPQHHDVDEGRREARSRSSRTARYGSRTSPSTPAASTPSSPATAPAAPGTRTPRSAPCTCAPSSTSRSTRGRARCGPSRRSASRWCASTGARTPASTVTASCGASSTKRCSARGSPARSRR